MAIEFGGANTADSGGAGLTSGAANTLGSYVELIASTARTSYLFAFWIRATSPDYEGVVYFATGAGGAESAFLKIPFHGNDLECVSVTVPFTVASGVRVSAALISTDASSTCDVTIALSDDASWGTCTQATLIGTSTAAGTAVDPGAVANTKPAAPWTELSSSAPHDCDMVLVKVGTNNNNIIGAYYSHLLDIGTGASSSESAVIENIMPCVNGGTEMAANLQLFYVPIASGARISARCQCNDVTDATDRLIDVCMVGFNLTAPAGGSASVFGR